LGTLCGFDRLVFRATPRRLNHFYWDQTRQIVIAKGMEEYLWQNKIHFKDYGRHVQRISGRVKDQFLKPFRQQNPPVMLVRDPQLDTRTNWRVKPLPSTRLKAGWYASSAPWSQVRHLNMSSAG